MRPSDRFFKDFQLTSYSSAGWKPWLARFVATPSPTHLIQTGTIMFSTITCQPKRRRIAWAESYLQRYSRGDRVPISAPVRRASHDSSVVCVGMYPVYRLFHSFWENLLSECFVMKRANWRRIAGAWFPILK